MSSDEEYKQKRKAESELFRKDKFVDPSFLSFNIIIMMLVIKAVVKNCIN